MTTRRTFWTVAAVAAVALFAPGRSEAEAKASSPESATRAQVVQLTVTPQGFIPAQVKVKAGQPVQLVVTRKTDRTCATAIVVKEYGVAKELPLGQPVTVTFTPTKAGQVRYACPMNMIAGTMIVE